MEVSSSHFFRGSLLQKNKFSVKEENIFRPLESFNSLFNSTAPKYSNDDPPLLNLHSRFSLNRDENLVFQPTQINLNITSRTYQEPKDEFLPSDETNIATTSRARGRPSNRQLKTAPILEQDFRYKCLICSRSFPRKKSLDTHILTHTDLKPYECDFPGCTRRFKQSGQLKTHQRLHTGEKPFTCTFPDCCMSFTHSNRKCPYHPAYPLRRLPKQPVVPLQRLKENESASQWLRRKYIENHTNSSGASTSCKTSVICKNNSVTENKRPVLKSIENGQSLKDYKERMITAEALIQLQNTKSYI